MSQLAALFESNAFRTLIAIVAIGVSILIYRLNKKKKALSYEVLRNDRIFRVVGSLASRVQITVDGKSANNVSLILVDIQNTGNEPIKETTSTHRYNSNLALRQKFSRREFLGPSLLILWPL